MRVVNNITKMKLKAYQKAKFIRIYLPRYIHALVTVSLSMSIFAKIDSKIRQVVKRIFKLHLLLNSSVDQRRLESANLTLCR